MSSDDQKDKPAGAAPAAAGAAVDASIDKSAIDKMFDTADSAFEGVKSSDSAGYLRNNRQRGGQ
jgi:hypothetical protein